MLRSSFEPFLVYFKVTEGSQDLHLPLILFLDPEKQYIEANFVCLRPVNFEVCTFEMYLSAILNLAFRDVLQHPKIIRIAQNQFLQNVVLLLALYRLH